MRAKVVSLVRDPGKNRVELSTEEDPKYLYPGMEVDIDLAVRREAYSAVELLMATRFVDHATTRLLHEVLPRLEKLEAKLARYP